MMDSSVEIADFICSLENIPDSFNEVSAEVGKNNILESLGYTLGYFENDF